MSREVAEAMMGNIASVFHWSLSDMDEMEVDELRRWHQLAADRASKSAK